MNRPLRRWHFRLVAGLAPVAFLTLVAAVAVRRTAPVNATPVAFQSQRGLLREVDRKVIRGSGLALELRRLVDSAGATQLELYPLGELQVADLLLYVGQGVPDSLPANARLLGAVTGAAGQRVILPEGATRLELYGYSGATRAVVAHTILFDQAGTVR